MQNSVDKNHLVDANHVRHSFNKAAKNYDLYSLLQQTVVERLMESFEHINVKPLSILDLGSGTGYGASLLKHQFKKAQIYQTDLSEEMLKRARKKTVRFLSKQRFLCADANKIPLPDNSIDLVFSNLMLQWCNDPDNVFAEIKRVLKPKGVFLFTSFGPDTLKELRASWQQADDGIHVNAFVDMHDIGDALIRNGMDAPVLNVEQIILMYDDCKQLLRELKNIGAHNVNRGRRKTLTGKQRFENMIEHYDTFRAKSQKNKFPATYEVIYGHAWKPDRNKVKGETNTQSVSLEDLKRDLKRRKSS
ncbi:MAG: malonyl-ACP O-methyltransferase BioC [Proteobacteria bacterium]|nr:malonyl-[acyl-carrier protein] O-methyltransferase BioC [Pseudomonadota bacterium]NOG60690.1 malonyl-ACP O-methyltransferase BioC [Pseudomonadota bacterium]